MTPYDLRAYCIYMMSETPYDQHLYVSGETNFYHSSIPKKLREAMRERLRNDGPSYAAQLAMLGKGPFTLLEARRAVRPKGRDRLMNALNEHGIRDMVYRLMIVPMASDPMEIVKIMVMLSSHREIVLTWAEREDLHCLMLRAAQRFTKVLRHKRQRRPKLTVKQTAVLQLVAEGYSNEQIASEYNVSVATAKAHIRQIFAKLGAKDRASAVYFAMQRRMIW